MAGVPALHAGRVQDGLALDGGFHADFEEAGTVVLEVLGEPHGAYDELRGAFHLLEPDAFVLEKVGVEQDTQGLADVVV